MIHNIFIQRCLDLGIMGLGKVAPNPLVGSVIVHNGLIIGEGYHEYFGGPHAEVNAINSVPENQKHLLSDSTLYVNLEPCAHHGKTPPCTDLIIEHKIPTVVVGSKDPNPLVSGKGIHRLKEAGVEVVTGVLKDKSDFLNRRFITFHTHHRPYIILKWAQSGDGFVAPEKPEKLWLTNDESRKLTHQWRSEEQAIMVGRRTVEIDNPELTVRLVKGKNPVRITIDRKLALHATHKIFRQDAQLILFNEIENYCDSRLHFVKIDFEKNTLPQMLDFLYSRQIQSVIIEGGPETLRHFVEQDLWDEARIFTAHKQMQSGKKAPVLHGKLLQQEQIEEDRLQIMSRI
jgi:diaminohydroxyphosphoribosylaminopyrimidine deaminase/5-amino-6-(5-phosphoribosylamino)uracil reductase